MTDQSLPEPDHGAEPARAPGPTPAVETALPADPAAYDSPRAALARARGLSAPYIPGGRDPDPEPALREERRLLRILIAMVVITILSGFVLAIIANLITAARGG